MASSYNELFGLGSHSEDANLEGWWPLQDDAASTAVDDASSNGNDATLGGGDNTADISTTGPNSYLAKSLGFDASADYAEANSGASAYDPITLAAWVRSSETFPTSEFAACLSDPTVSFRYASIGYQRTGGVNYTQSDVRISASGQNLARTASYTQNAFAHIALTLSSGEQTTFVGGSSVASASPGTPDNTPTKVNIGRLIHSSSTIYGRVDVAGVSLFSRALIEAEIAQIAAGPEPINSVAPAVSGTETEGQTLSCTTGTWGLDAPFSSGSNGTITYSYQWTRSDNASGLNEADIAGATSNTYTLVTADVGKFIRCRVRATNDGGFDSAADTNSDMTGEIAASGGASVAPDDAAHAHAAESPTITQAHAIQPDSCTHAHAVDSPALTQVHAVQPADAVHAHAAESPTLLQAHQVAPADCLHDHASDSPTLTQVHVVSPADCLHGHSAESPSVAQQGAIQPDECLHSHAADSPLLTQVHVVAPADCLHAHAAESPTVTPQGGSITITPNDCLHAHTAASPHVSITGALLVGYFGAAAAALRHGAAGPSLKHGSRAAQLRHGGSA